MKASIEGIRELREVTNAPVVDCKDALTQAKGDLDKAVEILRKKGLAEISKKSTRSVREGCVESYIHMGGKIGVLVEVNCETDFVARCDEFRKFVKDVTLQIAAANPLYIRREDIPPEMVEKETEIIKSQCEGKPEHVVEKIVAGKLETFYQKVCLLNQPFIKDQEVTIKDYLALTIAKLGENVVIKRFTRYQLGERTESRQ